MAVRSPERRSQSLQEWERVRVQSIRNFLGLLRARPARD